MFSVATDASISSAKATPALLAELLLPLVTETALLPVCEAASVCSLDA